MATIVYCTTATSAADAAVDANENLPTAGWKPATGHLPDGDPAGTVCDKNPDRKHWLLTDEAA